MTRKTLVVLAILAIALVVLVISTDARRGGMRDGSGGMGGSGGGVAPVPDGNYDAPTGGCGNYNLPPGNYGPGNYDALDVCVSTDKRVYAEGEPMEIEVMAYNPLDSVITLVFGTSSHDSLGCQAYYAIDGTFPEWSSCNAAMDYIPIPPKGSHSWLFTHTESVFPVDVGRHSVVGSVGRYGQSDPLTIDVLGPAHGGNYDNGGNVDNGGNTDLDFLPAVPGNDGTWYN